MLEKNKNRPLGELDGDFVRKTIKAAAFDIDGVVVKAGTVLEQSLDGSELTIKTNKLSSEMAEMLNELKEYIRIIFVSGRSVLHLESIVEDILWSNISLIGENGNFLLTDGRFEQLAFYDEDYFQKLVDIREDFEALKKKRPDVIHGFEPKHMIITLHTSEKVPEVEKIVKKHDKEGELYCLWTSEGYDIGHVKTNKRTALEILSDRVGLTPGEIITTGNNLNDREMLEFGVGISVNPDLVEGEYAVPPKPGILGGEVIARHLLDSFKGKSGFQQ